MTSKRRDMNTAANRLNAAVIARVHITLTRPLDAAAAAIVVVLCLSWGFNQVAIKLAIHDIPPLHAARDPLGRRGADRRRLVQAARHAAVRARRHAASPGSPPALLFGVEFMLIYQGLVYTTATRAVLFIYLAPFFVVLGARIFLPGRPLQPGAMARARAVVRRHGGRVRRADAGARSAPDARRPDDGRRRAAWAATTLIIKASALNRVSAGKGAALSARGLGADAGARPRSSFGERITTMPSALALGALAYQTIWVVSITFMIWFALIVRYSASRLSAFTFLTPLFGVAAGHLVLGEPLTPAFAAAVALVAAGLVLVNRPR